MIILIAESKSMAAGTIVSEDDYVVNRPATEPMADAIMQQLAGMSVQELSHSVKISLAMARRLQQMILEFGDKTHGCSAIAAYTGEVFKALGYGTQSD
ncbi:MAG: YaaA family protein, partial [Muribaculaceae bacterium]|nr:YaaA family protein [Muribaculaceae bacterium]